MISPSRSKSRGYKLLLLLSLLTLALAMPATALAQDANPESPGGPPEGTPGTPPGNPGEGTTPDTGPGGPGPGGPDPGGPGPDPGGPGPGGPGPDPDPTPTPDDDDDDMMMMGPPAHELANRVVKHVATPVQLVIAGEGFQFFFIGPDGNTVSGPTFPSFAELAEMHPSGEWVSLLDAVNPLSGKQVYVDYIPKDETIRVFTYYPDKGMDVDKQYIFNFGADLSVNVEAW